jgi:hypothetical protein
LTKQYFHDENHVVAGTSFIEPTIVRVLTNNIPMMKTCDIRQVTPLLLFKFTGKNQLLNENRKRPDNFTAFNATIFLMPVC